MRVFDANTKRVLHRVNKSTLPVKEGHELHGRSIRLYHDGTLQTFFRRLCFTPDGKLLFTPAGVTDYDGVLKPTHTTYGYSRYDLSKPAFVLPFPNEYTVAVRCSPVLYRLRPYDAEKNPPMITLPYRMIYAVATKNSVFFYDTQQAVPFAIVSNIHYTRLTDLTWSNDGNILIVSSTDGFCSVLTFSDKELGERYEDMDAVLCAAAKSSENLPQRNRKIKRQKLRKNSLDESSKRKPLQDKTKANNIAAKPSVGKANECNESAETDLEVDNDSSMQSSGSANVAISPKPVVKADAKPTPIAFRRSPRKTTEPQPIAIRRKVKEATPTAAPIEIAVKRKATDDAEPLPNKPKQPIVVLGKPIEAVLDKEIISSDEKFESPEKKSRPATPIQVRRLPRTPGSSSSNTKTPKSVPHATPIAVRRTPRVLIEAPVVNTPVVVEEAMDAWPLAMEDVVPFPKEKSPGKKAEANTQLAISEVTIERTEDMRLVYEDTQEETPTPVKKGTPAKKGTPVKAAAIPAKEEATAAATTATLVASPKPSTPKGKTPRRVSLRTISTPKSKKKLLD